MAWAIVATVGGRLNDCENFKKTLVGVQWYSVQFSQPQIQTELPAKLLQLKTWKLARKDQDTLQK